MAVCRASLLVLCAAACLAAVQAQLVIEEASRKIDVSSFRAAHNIKLALRNDGSAPEEKAVLCFSSGLLEHAAVIEAAAGDVKLQWADATPPAGTPAGLGCRAFRLPQPLAPGGRLALEVDAIFTHVLRPEPAQIKQNEPQRVVYEDSAVLPSPYSVEKQSTEVATGTANIPSFTSVPPAKKEGQVLRYGPYEDTPPLALKPIVVHYENHAPFAQVTELVREIDVSHWGTVYFEERYSLRHAGARIAGEWSRYDLMTRPAEFARTAIPGLAASLPPSAHSLYYRDAIGNISSSEVRYGADRVVAQLQPRYPLFGGWATSFVFGWSLPLQAVVGKSETGRTVFAATAGPSVHGLVVDRLTVRLLLPEGSSGVQVSSGLRLDAPPAVGSKLTYLDVLGRPVVELRASNVVDETNTLFRVEYSYSSLGLVQKPLLLLAALGTLIAAAVALNRLGGSSKGGAAGKLKDS